MRARLLLWLLLLLGLTPVGAQPASGVLPGQNFDANSVFQALASAYPDWVTLHPGFFQSVLSVDGHDFVWASGRLLPPEKADHWADFAPQPFYDYPSEVPDVASWSDERIADTEAHLADRRNTPLRRDSGFFDALWGIHGRASADDAQRKIRFLGLRVTVHRSLVAPLARIEAKLKTQRTADPSLDRFLKTLDELDGYNWRDIAETQSRSNHAYGAAIDFVPRSFRGKTPYWLWSADDKGPWFRAAWAKRWEPHPTLVQDFEDEGFIWGGKWVLFDTIHFEYRPEILVLNHLR